MLKTAFVRTLITLFQFTYPKIPPPLVKQLLPAPLNCPPPSPLPPGKAEKGKRDSLSHFQGPVPGLLKKVHWTAKRPSKQLRSTLLDTSTPGRNVKAFLNVGSPLALMLGTKAL